MIAVVGEDCMRAGVARGGMEKEGATKLKLEWIPSVHTLPSGCRHVALEAVEKARGVLWGPG
jgi:hypothetical protein